ncbi:hypothetical protein PIECOFPK_02415 [Mycovorax composti]|mgnify:CR=1 FL=1|jgi:Putative regulator of cell autolysis|uniref:Signal transduction histidine kinase internal region domain-containing protein n=1 Tax=Mycovorax composti TaxID=2962693 RepID=A0ABZ2EMA2_9BACT
MIIGKRYYWVLQILGWSAFFFWHLFLAWSLDKMNDPQERIIMIQRMASFSILGLILSHLLRIAILKTKVLSLKVSKQIALLLLYTLITSFVCGIIEWVVLKKLELLHKSELGILNKSLLLLLLNNAFSWFFYFLIWSSVYFGYHYITKAQQEQIDNLILKSHIKELELKTIKTHINPHFIFNALNGIRAMVDEDPQRARRAITELSNILRSSINLDKSETIALSDELNIVKDYLALEQMRFESRLQVSFNIEEETLYQQIPPMMLQMLVENAIKHGISHEVNGGIVKLTSTVKNGLLELIVENTGQLKATPPDSGFGIKSIRERLSLVYGDNATFEIKQAAPHIVEAKLQLPLTL